ncbi:3-hydroxyacyl-ACP dehydratase FabZ family protein [Nocardia crassostreae]|uniref:3-hydroxyacyl-ACP dehydratase FabZ family protein n=1 Tax=Nocardia crassostreae TaxID=53428 RepID=UPI00082B6988|nr:MaoC/PaaZ C-terminal domain-containing protein [Nocardia crassostreae]
MNTYASCTSAPDSLRREGDEAVLVKRIAADEPYLSGHFPGDPVYPGVFLIDLCLKMIPVLCGVAADRFTLHSVRFFAPVRPGDEITVRGTSSGADTRFLGRKHDGTKAFTLHLSGDPA